MNLLETYREYMSHFDVAAPPVKAIERGFYVPRPNSVVEEIAPRVLLEPASTHLLVGGIGSGKTTELFQIRDRINQIPDTHAFYVDVAEQHDLRHLDAGVLVLLAGLSLSMHMKKTLIDPSMKKEAVPPAVEAIVAAARGSWNDPSYSHDEDDDKVWTPGKLKRPGPSHGEVVQYSNHVKQIRNKLAGRLPHIVFLFDSLDRIDDASKFIQIVEQDVAALKKIGIGVVLVGALPTLYGPVKSVVQHFDQDLFLPDVDPTEPGSGFDFLYKVLRARASAELLPDPVCQRVVAASGGVLRDLISLAKAAGQRAFMAGAPAISIQHVEIAARVAGQKLLFGVDKEGKSVLDRMAAGGSFELATDKDLELLQTRRVLQYLDRGMTRYALHPLLLPLLQGAAVGI